MSKVSKITLFMLVDLTNKFLKYVLYLQTFLPGLLPHCNLTYMTSEKNYLTSSISFDMSYLKITFQTQFSGTSNTLISIDDFSIEILGLFTQNEADWTASFNSQLKGTFINDITNHCGLEMF